jgi:hypothetical protein
MPPAARRTQSLPARDGLAGVFVCGNSQPCSSFLAIFPEFMSLFLPNLDRESGETAYPSTGRTWIANGLPGFYSGRKASDPVGQLFGVVDHHWGKWVGISRF